ncbi:MAG: response regulator [Chloroflexota bacterium]|nr:response regulator [Chloroflexota bacterium]
MTAEHGRILVVDDNRVNRLKLSLSLEQQGHTVALAEDGEQALDILQAQPFDVVLLDIIMPGLDGYQVLERVKSDAKLRDIPIIVISALDEIDSAVRCIEMGAEDYLPKPFNPVLLRARLNSSLQKKKLRDLEKAYLQQEFMLRQTEKLATLGRLSAGMAHELNNPAAAARRGASQLQATFSHLQQTYTRLVQLNLTGEQLKVLSSLDTLASEATRQSIELDPLARSDLEAGLEDWLREQGVQNAWELAPSLVSLGYTPTEAPDHLQDFSPDELATVIEWLHNTYLTYSLLAEIDKGTERISDIIKALKAYSYMDQAPAQSVDVHEGLDNTLAILQSRLHPGVVVHREYATGLPRIEAYGSELNQVWTNLIDNAIDAMNAKGELTLRTHFDDNLVVVEIQDTGVGIPEAILAKIFDPFFTTKPPGKGPGLGLSVAHAIVAQKHGGSIEVFSQPGKTRFEVRLPLRFVHN